MAWFYTLGLWHWLILAVLLLGAETLGTGGFLLGAAIAALLTALLSGLLPELGWAYQVMAFALQALLYTLLYLRLFKGFNQTTDAPLLNARVRQLIGKVVVTEEDIVNGQGRIQIGDTYWSVLADEDIAAGSTVEVIDAREMDLLVKKR